MTKMNKRSLIALLVSLALVLSFLTVGVLADEADAGNGNEETTTTTAAENEGGNEEESTTTTAGEEETTTKKEETTTTAAHDHDHEDGEDEPKDYTNLIVTLSILAVIIIACVVLAIVNRVKLKAFLRSVKSEMKKIVWSPKEQTRKNFLVVMVICIAVIVLVAALDIAFGKGISALAEWIKSFRA